MPYTGRVRYREYDRNPFSPTFGESRWGAYVSDPAKCPPATRYTSAAVSGNVSRNNCPSGQTTQPVLYTVVAGSFSSYVSQADADQQAQAYFNSTKQDYANQNGVCGGRSLRITSVTKLARTVQVQVTRANTDGSVVVDVEVKAVVDDNGSTSEVTETLTVTIADGQLQASNVVGFGRGTVVQVLNSVILSSTPNNYTF